MKIERLKNSVQYYPWGTTDFIPSLLGVDNSEGKPFAELWMGDHPRGPSYVVSSDLPLGEIEKSFPDAFLGSKVVSDFGTSLPFLFKVLSAGKPLSLQAHPDKRQAEEGFKRENDLGIPLDAFNRNYRDNNHKPEIICAITPFTAMCGFRSPGEIDKLFLTTGSESYSRSLENTLRGGGGKSLEVFFTTFMKLGEDEILKLISEVVSWAKTAAKAGAEEQGSLEAKLIVEFYDLYGNDRGILSPLFLNVVELSPGQALYQGPGELHAYVRGTGIELMANSDNVLRGGMTQKNIDVDELLSILTFSDSSPKILEGVEYSPCVYEYKSPVKEFLLRRFSLQEGCTALLKERNSVEIFLCLKGEGAIMASGQKVSFSKGSCFVIPADISEYTVEGSGECYAALVPGGDTGEGSL